MSPDHVKQRKPQALNKIERYAFGVGMVIFIILFIVWMSQVQWMVNEYKQSAIQSIVSFMADGPPQQCRGPIGEVSPVCDQPKNRLPIFAISCLWLAPVVYKIGRCIYEIAHHRAASWWRNSVLPYWGAHVFFCVLLVLAGIGLYVM